MSLLGFDRGSIGEIIGEDDIFGQNVSQKFDCAANMVQIVHSFLVCHKAPLYSWFQ